MAQSDNPNPKMQLPETWATRMSCPICAARPLGVFHPTGHADRFACPTCETSFELEEAGKRVRFVTLPPGVTPWMRGEWVVLEEALAAFEIFKNGQSQINMEGTPKAEISTPPAPEEVNAPPQEPGKSTPEPVNPPADLAFEIPAEQPEKPGDQFLFPSDKLDKPASGSSPFYEEDFDEYNAFIQPVLAEESQSENDVWKNQELERVREALKHPPSGDFVGQLSQNELDGAAPAGQQPVGEPEKTTETPPVAASKPVLTVPASWKAGEPPTDQKPVDYSALDNPPPIRPLEDTPPAIIQPAKAQPRVIYNSPEENLGELRDHIAGASVNVSTLNEKMEAAAERAVELHRLGNTPQEVRSILERSSGLTPEQVNEVLNNIEKPEEKRKSSRLILIFLIVTVAIFTILAWFFYNQYISSPAGTPSESTQKEFSLAGKLIDPTVLPAQLQTLMPGGLQIFNEPPTVDSATEAEIPAASCPTTPSGAASLYGGQPAEWSKDNQSNGWILITKTQGAQVRVPANMSGGYMVFEKGPEMRGVSGPAIIRNVYMASVSCP